MLTGKTQRNLNLIFFLQNSNFKQNFTHSNSIPFNQRSKLLRTTGFFPKSLEVINQILQTIHDICYFF